MDESMKIIAEVLINKIHKELWGRKIRKNDKNKLTNK